MDPLARLGSKHKWFLAGGHGALYAPPFPKHLLATGFWDECYFADIRIPRLFTALFLDEMGVPIRFDSYHKGWRPDRLTIMHYSGNVVIRERRCVTEGNAWVSEFELVTAVRPLHVLMWSLIDMGSPLQSLGDLQVQGDSVLARVDTAWPSQLEADRTAIESSRGFGQSEEMLPAIPLYLQMGGDLPRHSWTVNLAQRHDESPLYELSVAPEKFRNGKLPGDFKVHVGTEPVEGLVHVVQHYQLTDRRPLQLVCGSGLTQEAARKSFDQAKSDIAIDRSAESWRKYFQGVPQFESSDEHLTNAYWYRWYGVRLNTVDVPNLPLQTESGRAGFAPYVTEGVGFFRNFVTYSAQAHLREVSWMHSPELGGGILDNLCQIQREDGSFPGHSYSGRRPRDFYHADFATGLRQMHFNHPGSVGKEHLQALRRYANYLLTQRTVSADPAKEALYDVFDQNETGQEYMSRYLFASENADKWQSFRVSGVDATVYAGMLYELLAEFRSTSSPYEKYAHGVLEGLKSLSWDADASFFFDRSMDGLKSPYKPATGFYPLLLRRIGEILSQTELNDLIGKWLSNPDEFWLPKGFPATAMSDSTFSAEGEWKEKRLNCPWNGRSWPMANSHLVDGLANASLVDESLRPLAAEGFMKAIRLMFHRDDPHRPSSFEHYDPISGTASLYRGYDDYMHSWIVDLVMRHAVGVVPGSQELRPLPIDVDWIQCAEIPTGQGLRDVRIEGGVVVTPR